MRHLDAGRWRKAEKAARLVEQPLRRAGEMPPGISAVDDLDTSWSKGGLFLVPEDGR